MGSQKVKEAPPAPEEQEKVHKETVVKKWKGKDWFMIQAPKMFNQMELGEIPATDPKFLTGRILQVNLSELTGNPSKYYMKLHFKVDGIEGNIVSTRFHGMHLIKEQVFRVVRKRTSKVEIVQDVTTKDGWVLHIKMFAILNRVSNVQIERKIRKEATQQLEEFVTKADLAEVIKTASDGLIQKNIKKFGSKIYPIRFCEVVKIEVKKVGK